MIILTFSKQKKVLSKAGPATTYQRRDHSHDIGSLATGSDAGSSRNGGGGTQAVSTGASASHQVNAISSTPSAALTEMDGSATSSYQDYSSNLQDYNFKTSSFTNVHDTSNGSGNGGVGAHIIRINPPPMVQNAAYAASNEINQDPDPIRIVRPNNQSVVYKQQVSIRYLQPPTPPPPAPIIIREKQMPPPPSQPPIIIRFFSSSSRL